MKRLAIVLAGSLLVGCSQVDSVEVVDQKLGVKSTVVPESPSVNSGPLHGEIELVDEVNGVPRQFAIDKCIERVESSSYSIDSGLSDKSFVQDMGGSWSVWNMVTGTETTPIENGVSVLVHVDRTQGQPSGTYECQATINKDERFQVEIFSR